MSPHLTEETLNEYLDGALPGAARAGAEAHLAGCGVCAARLKALSALFAGLEALPEAPLQRDLRLGVMSAVHARRPTALRPIADPRRPAFRVVFAVEALAALALLAFSWPFLSGLAGPLPSLMAVNLAALVAPLAGNWPDPDRLWPALQGWLMPAATFPISSPATLLTPLVAGLVLLAGGVFWVLGNALLLRQRPAPRLRRK